MANTFFQFKKFIVHQEHTSMKVCTDACLFGAWAIEHELLQKASSILDIGTGTGLLSLMVAQKNTIAKITAVEIEPNAAKQASSNFELSDWKERLSVVNTSIQDFLSSFTNQFDCIISNPPFFETDLPSPDNNKNLAAHSAALPWETFAEVVSKLLSDEGLFFVIIPSIRAYTMQKHMEANGLLLIEDTTVFNKEKQLPFRSFLQFKKTIQKPSGIKRNKLFIKEVNNEYTEVFKSLLKDYYLLF
jgi:tRNA1Val (adenine37-N6)-methyltransferase